MTIRILPPRLANQIAAGEVVERPASVIKELVENSLDAGATLLEVQVEQGGHKRILVRDNGSGIAKDELTLALSRHATSKVTHLDDIEAIATLGFRGEALASISSVSRLTLTSKTAEQSEAWLAYAEGREMEVQIKPAAHPNGTSIEVTDLFFNTPARRKFLRAEKTEFHHIDELIKRLAMARFEVGFKLTHNGKVVRNLPACKQDAAKLRRIGMLCGQGFSQQALHLSSESGSLKLEGWVMPSHLCTLQSPAQYTFINGRMIRDKVVTHAIRQAYSELMPDAALSAYALYLTLPYSEVDVNVHPAKHEVRFSQSRLVHDFVVQAVQQALRSQSGFPVDLTTDEEEQTETLQFDQETGEILSPEPAPQSYSQSPENQSVANFAQEHSVHRKDTNTPAYPNQRRSASSGESYGQPRGREKGPSLAEWQSYHALMSPTAHESKIQEWPSEPELRAKPESPETIQKAPAYQLIPPHHALFFKEQSVWMVDLKVAELELATELYPLPWKGQPLLLPLAVPLESEQAQQWQALEEGSKPFGITIHVLNQKKLIIKTLPAQLRQADLVSRLDELQRALSLPEPEQQAQALLALCEDESKERNPAQIEKLLAKLPAQPTNWLKELKAEQLLSIFN